jgi:hypothetical protein
MPDETDANCMKTRRFEHGAWDVGDVHLDALLSRRERSDQAGEIRLRRERSD